MNNKNIYHVQGTDETRNFHIAYCTGNPDDIKRYFENEGGYGLQLDLIKILEITTESANEKTNILKRKKEIENELKEIQKYLAN